MDLPIYNIFILFIFLLFFCISSLFFLLSSLFFLLLCISFFFRNGGITITRKGEDIEISRSFFRIFWIFRNYRVCSVIHSIAYVLRLSFCLYLCSPPRYIRYFTWFLTNLKSNKKKRKKKERKNVIILNDIIYEEIFLNTNLCILLYICTINLHFSEASFVKRKLFELYCEI